MSDLPSAASGQDNTASPKSQERRTTPLGISWGALLAWGAILTLLAILALGLVRAQRGPVSKGEIAPSFSMSTFDGKQIDMADLSGKVVVVNFWASWCKPCEEEADDLEAAWQYYKPGGQVVFLGVDYVDTEPEALAYLEKYNITFPNGPDLGTRISQAYRIRGVPETFFINQQGRLTYFQKGPFPSLARIQAVIDPLLEP